MIYNDRVSLLRPKYKETRLGKEKIGNEEIVIPCQRGQLTHNEQMGMFGSYQFDTFKLHVQGDLKDVSEIIYHGEKRQVKGLVAHKNATVIYV